MAKDEFFIALRE